MVFRTVTSLRDISEKTWVHSYPMMPHAFTFHSCGKCLRLFIASCLPSWSAMHDVCVTCAKKCAVAICANVLKVLICLEPTTTKQNTSNSSYLVEEVTPQILSLNTKPFVIFTDECVFLKGGLIENRIFIVNWN